MIDLDGVADDGLIVPADDTPPDNAGADIENLFLITEGEEGPDLGIGGNDILTGNASANQIEGGPGDDQINGLGGPDELIGGPGDDELDGGNGIDGMEGQGGADRIRSRDSKADEVGCGSSSDTLLADSLDVFSVTCDSSSTGPLLKTKKTKLNKKGKAKVPVSCPAAEGIDCQVKVTVKKGKKVVARASGKVGSGKQKKLTLKLTKQGKKISGKKISGKAETTMTDAAGAKAATSRKLVIRR
jgi:Ca2+-binding RTX toxin-like protein